MKDSTLKEIKRALLGGMKKAEKKSSIDEKRQFYKDYLERIIDMLDLDEDVDVNSEQIEELISDNFLFIKPQKISLFEDEGYTPWLEDVRQDITWEFYDRYEQFLLEEKGWKPKNVVSIRETSDIILDHMANPKSEKYFKKQGLVIGDIQSGKTANYTAVINKAIDAGYKLIIVLAGITRDLRNQTQNRLDSEVLGYQTKTSGKGKNIGVGLIKPLHIEGLTYSDTEKDYGDMKKYFSTHTLDKNLNPIVAIVKKNCSVLKNLKEFLTKSQDYCYTNGKLDIPVLIIDDEVDQASVDTKNSDAIEGASTINKLIRQILSSLNRYSYVGYTATPFANVFIDPDKESDIYPNDFILCIPSPADYCGVKEYFGINIQHEDYISDHTNDLFVKVDDYQDLFETNDKISAQSSTKTLNKSLKEAIMSFIVASSVKKSRCIFSHNSMLIHIARFKNPATTLKPLILDHINNMYHKLKYEFDVEVENYKTFWEEKFKTVSQTRQGQGFKDKWENIEKYLLPTLESAINNVKVLNGDSGDVIDYSISKTGDYIVIGGDKLSRGLTLNGLVISYYYRKTRMYDSLLQMGRWFGYRKGWVDVCRIYTATRFMNDFINVGKVLQKFKDDIEEMYVQKLNPRDVGQRILYSPNLIPTSANKMKSATKARVSFSGAVQQIISFDKKNNQQNLELTNNFIQSLSNGIYRGNKVVFYNVSTNKVLNYLRKYKEVNGTMGYGQISIRNWIKYIENLNSKGELTNWTILLHSIQKKEAERQTKIGGYTIYKPTRTLRDTNVSTNTAFYTIKTNIAPSDFREIYNPTDKEYSSITHYDATKEYSKFTHKDALMVIYVVDLYEKVLDNFDVEKNEQKYKRGPLIQDGIDMVAPAIWFPNTLDYEASATTYYTNLDYQKKQDEIEFGGNEDD